jgi:ACS family hexuronate transporter-like MFS transporter
MYYEKPTEQKRISASELAYINTDVEVEDTYVDGKITNKISWSTLLSYKQTWAFAFGKFMTDGVWWFFLFWLPGYLKDQYSMEGTAIILPLSILYSMTMVGSVGGGYFPTYFINKGMKAYDGRMKAMLTIAFIPLIVLAVQPLGYISYWVPVIFIGIGTAAHQAWSANIYTTVSDMFPKRSIATVIGIGGMAGGMGGVLVSKVGGWMFDAYKLTGVKQAWEQASSTGFGDYLNTIKSAQITDKKGVLIDLTQKDWSNLTKDVQAKIQALDPSHYDTFLAIQKHAVHDSLTTAYTIMFAFCALAYLIAWSVMKALVPKEKIINL